MAVPGDQRIGADAVVLTRSERRTLPTSDYAYRHQSPSRTGVPGRPEETDLAVAKSKVRKKAVYTPPQKSKAPEVSPRWLAPLMVTLWLVGLLWIAVFYVTASTGTDVPVMSGLHNWNLGIGFALIILGLVAATRWR